MKLPPKRRIKRRATTTKEQTRDALLASGLKLFAKRGLDGPSLDDICADAGLTRGAFYVHFKDREDFLVAVMDRVGLSLLDELFAAGAGGFAGAIQRFVTASAAGRYPLMPEGGVRPYQLLDACARSASLRERYVALVNMSAAKIGELVGEGQRQGALRSDITPKAAATFVMAAVIGLQTLADLGIPAPLGELSLDVIRLFSPRPGDGRAI